MATKVRWRRVQLIELEDLAYFPAVLRDAGTSYLRLAITLSGHASLLVPKIAEVLRSTGKRRIIDLCAGGGGPLPIIMNDLAKQGIDVDATVTDLFPNLPAFQRMVAANPRIHAETRSIDATAVPSDLDGLRVIFNAFHHLPPPIAAAVLTNAVRDQQPIAIFEVVSREPAQLFGLFLSPLLFTLTLPWLRPFRWAWLVWTFLIPVLPFFILWDGIVSWLRIYGVGELEELVENLNAPGWTWDIGTIKLGSSLAHATYLVGTPPGN